MQSRRAWATERLETRAPATLVGCALLLDALADGSAVLHGLGLASRALVLTLCVVFAVAGVGRFGGSSLARRFSLWRACGLFAAGACIGLEVLVRWPLLLRPTEGGFALDAIGILWILLTGAVWDRSSWVRLQAAGEQLRSGGSAPSWHSLRTSA
jgi:hypothetical protein